MDQIPRKIRSRSVHLGRRLIVCGKADLDRLIASDWRDRQLRNREAQRERNATYFTVAELHGLDFDEWRLTALEIGDQHRGATWPHDVLPARGAAPLVMAAAADPLALMSFAPRFEMSILRRDGRQMLGCSIVTTPSPPSASATLS